MVPGSSAWTVVSSMEQSVALPIDRLPQKFIVKFSEIRLQRTILQLHQPIELILEKVDGGWICEEPTFSLSAFGETSAKAVCSVFEDFVVLWDEIAQASDDSLSDDAQGVKCTLLSLVKSVAES